ncbi:MAG TPA: hypothetical protein VKO42_01290 [Patescibacteria group bacterium]|nr:hypothetical protein [Patescibacteria group bacterium]
MTLEKWQQIVGQIKDNFSVEEHDSYQEEEPGGAEVEYLIFPSPLGRTKLEFIAKPVLLEKRTNYSKRAGADVRVENVYSEEEKTYTMKAYQWDEETDDWTEIDPKNFQL